MKKHYDLIVSLGGNCSAAHNLLYRNMRHFALPFDWCYFKDDKPLSYLCEGFVNNFKNFCLKENLVELPPEEQSPAHSDRIQYKDNYTGYYFVNHFSHPIEDEQEYTPQPQKLHRRTTRLITKIKESKNVLFILTFDFKFDFEKIKSLKKTLTKTFPKTKFFFEILYFNSQKDTKKVYGGVQRPIYKKKLHKTRLSNNNT